MPHLQLKLTSESIAGQNNSCRFSEHGGSIGRAEECDWTLVDNDRFISKKHLVISIQNQQFVLTDMSSNGVFVNNSGTPLGKGNHHVLKLSDNITLGKHVILVDQIDMSADVLSSSSQAEVGDSDLLGLVMGGAETESKPLVNTIPDIPEIINKQAEQPEGDLGLKEILADPIKQTTTSNPAASVTSESFSLGNEPNSDATSDLDSLIPDDWELSEIMPVTENYKPSNDFIDTKNKPLQPESAFEINTFDSATLNPEPQKNELPITPKDLPLVEEHPAESTITSTSFAEKVEVAPEPTKPEVSVKSEPKISEPVEKNVSKDAFFNVLYEKLGLPKEYRDNIDPNVFADDIVDVLLSTTSGLMSLLNSRMAFKQEARLSATLIQPKSNNPIKFSIDPVDTLEMLLLKKKKGYMTAKDSYDEAISDIHLHQTAFISGLQSSLVGVLNELSPDEIEKKITEKTPRFMGLNSNSQCWQLYKEQQPALLKSVSENLNDILGNYFSDAYQAQINNLKNNK